MSSGRPFTERRRVARQKSFIRGRAFFNHRRSSIDCIVRDFTKDGARLEFAELPSLPDVFEVFIPSKDEFLHARAIWHKGPDIGVRWALEGTNTALADVQRSSDPINDRLTRLEHEVAALRQRLDALQG